MDAELFGRAKQAFRSAKYGQAESLFGTLLSRIGLPAEDDRRVSRSDSEVAKLQMNRIVLLDWRASTRFRLHAEVNADRIKRRRLKPVNWLHAAVEDAKEMIVLMPAGSRGYLRLAKLLCESNQVKQAIKLVERAMTRCKACKLRHLLEAQLLEIKGAYASEDSEKQLTLPRDIWRIIIGNRLQVVMLSGQDLRKLPLPSPLKIANLTVHDCKIAPDFAQALPEKLRVLRLSNLGLMDQKGINCTRLRALVVHECVVREAFMEKMVAANPLLDHLQSPFVYKGEHCLVSYKGSEMVAAHNLSVIDCSAAKIHSDNVYALSLGRCNSLVFIVAPKIVHLELQNMSIQAEDLRRFPELRSVHLLNCTQVTDRLVQGLLAMPSLCRLAIFGCSWTVTARHVLTSFILNGSSNSRGLHVQLGDFTGIADINSFGSFLAFYESREDLHFCKLEIGPSESLLHAAKHHYWPYFLP